MIILLNMLVMMSMATDWGWFSPCFFKHVRFNERGQYKVESGKLYNSSCKPWSAY